MLQLMTLPSFSLISPVQIYGLIMAIVLIVPFLSRKLHIPPIFGLILAGVAIGPKGLDLVGDTKLLALLSQAGLLYLMFLAALEIDLFYFRKNRHKSLLFGVLTFIVPFLTGMFVTFYIFHYTMVAALLISCMFSTHTLISYPIVRRLNITQKEPVIISIGGTILTDTTVLFLLSIIVAGDEGALTFFFWLKMFLLLGFVVAAILWGLPKLARWYFSHIQTEENTQYIFVLTALFASGILAEVAGIEPIVGAFLCGLALNNVIPRNSVLMDRTAFIGNSVFIPVFLISIGMLIDLQSLFQGPAAMILAFTLVVTVLFGKYLAALITQKILGHTRMEGLLLFGLSSSHAAATIAVVSVGYGMGILDIHVLNATVLIILCSCLVSTYFTEHAGRKVALEGVQSHQTEALNEHHIIVPISNMDTAKTMIRIGILLELSEGDTVIYPTHIVTDEKQIEETRAQQKPIMDKISAIARNAGMKLIPSTRIDINVASGIQRVAKEIRATHIIAGWSGQSSTANYFFGNIIENMLSNYTNMILVVKFPQPRYKFRNIWIVVPDNADLETNCYAWIQTALLIRKNSGGEPLFLGNAETLAGIKAITEMRTLEDKNFREVDIYPHFERLNQEMTDEDLLIAVSARKDTVSYHRKLTVLPRLITRFVDTRNCIILFPGQEPG